MSEPVGIVGWGTTFPPHVETAAELVERTGIPENILREKMGIHQRHIAGEADTVTAMAMERGGQNCRQCRRGQRLCL
ncbi:MAG: hypothetical protein IPK19_33595 [Chloroflexi bacterium]|nr:hypothetical protein [Chloroflexota bacterium]